MSATASADPFGPRRLIALAMKLGLIALLLFGGSLPSALADEPTEIAQASPPLTASPSSHGAEALQPIPHWAWSLPFVVLLLLIATLPLVQKAHRWWENNLVKLAVGLGLGLIVLGYYALRDFGYHGATTGWPTVQAVLRHSILDDYIPFIILLFSLYVISGGLQIRGDLLAFPAVNTGILALGAVSASFIGTTGASMVLIRPLLQSNRDRKYVVHTVIFFIFLVSNIGGSVLPIGDPPLFLGYLKGVPFFWTFYLLIPWAFCVSTLLVVYYLWDRFYAFPREPKQIVRLEREHYSPLRLNGWVNLVYLLGVVASVAFIVPGKPLLPGASWVVPTYLREGIMLALSALSLATTPRGLRQEVQFNYTAIAEVAALFLGIFLTMQVPIEILQIKGGDLPLHEPWHFFWATGLLSSVLDNAPTYLVFFESARSLGSPAGVHLTLLDGTQIGQDILEAISLGAVFMGAMTYIGNGPNFMVKSIAEGQGIRMPSFFGYMVYSALILTPLLVIVSMFLLY